MKTIGIIGAGTMGAGIAQSVATAGMNVLLYDVSKVQVTHARTRIAKDLDRAISKGLLEQKNRAKILSRITTSATMKQFSGCSIIIEAIIEDLKVKQTLFQSLEKLSSPATLLASNTSSLSITAISSRLQHPERFLGLHFFNPVPKMKLVEIVKGHRTSPSTISQGVEFITKLQKIPIQVKDTPGFIVNRVARPFYGEALRLLGEGVASLEDIDRIVTLEGCFKMGPFELMDFIGIDVNLAVTKSVYEQSFHEPRYRPHLIQQQMVDAGLLGKKTNKGFYSYNK